MGAFENTLNCLLNKILTLGYKLCLILCDVYNKTEKFKVILKDLYFLYFSVSWIALSQLCFMGTIPCAGCTSGWTSVEQFKKFTMAQFNSSLALSI